MTVLCITIVIAALFITLFNSHTNHQVHSSDKSS